MTVIESIKKRRVMNKRYFAPEVTIFEVGAERGYQASVEGPGISLPNYGTDTDEIF